jgi:hypothetical protein
VAKAMVSVSVSVSAGQRASGWREDSTRQIFLAGGKIKIVSTYCGAKEIGTIFLEILDGSILKFETRNSMPVFLYA